MEPHEDTEWEPLFDERYPKGGEHINYDDEDEVRYEAEELKKKYAKKIK